MTLPAGAMIGSDTVTSQANFSEVVDVMIATAEGLDLEFAVMMGLVTRVDIPRGSDRIRIPYQDSIFEAQAYTDGDEISVVQRFSLDTLELTTTQLQLTYRISDRALRFSTQDLGSLAGEELARAQQERFEVDLLSLGDDTGSIDLGAAGANTTLSHIRNTRTLLRNVARSQGGPAKDPIVLVINPIQEDHLLADLGVGAVAGSAGDQRIPNGLTQEIIENGWFSMTILRLPIFVSGYIAQTVGSVTAPSLGIAFSKRALILGVAKDWDVKPYDESHWPGIIVRAMTDYGARVGPFPQHVIQFDTDVATL